MILTEKDFIVVEIRPEHIDKIEENTNKAVAGLVTFQSWIRDNKSRIKNLRRDQLTGQLTTYAASIALTGSPDGYFEAREIANANPTRSDNGVDIIGLSNVDVKGSYMRTSNKPLFYSLLVRPKERHDGWVYINALVPKKDPGMILVTGGYRDEDLPEGVYAGEYRDLHGAHKVDIKYLKSLIDIDQYIIRT